MLVNPLLPPALKVIAQIGSRMEIILSRMAVYDTLNHFQFLGGGTLLSLDPGSQTFKAL